MPSNYGEAICKMTIVGFVSDREQLREHRMALGSVSRAS